MQTISMFLFFRLFLILSVLKYCYYILMNFFHELVSILFINTISLNLFSQWSYWVRWYTIFLLFFSFNTQMNIIIKNIIYKFSWATDNMPKNDFLVVFIYLSFYSIGYIVNPNKYSMTSAMNIAYCFIIYRIQCSFQYFNIFSLFICTMNAYFFNVSAKVWPCFVLSFVSRGSFHKTHNHNISLALWEKKQWLYTTSFKMEG